MPKKGGHNTPEQLQQNRNWHKEWHALFHPFAGTNNPNYGVHQKSYRKGKIEITDGSHNKWIDKDDIIPEGWHRGEATNHLKIKEAYIHGINTETD